MRKGGLNVAAYSLFLLIRDVCRGDLVGWIDDRLASSDPGAAAPNRAALMRTALLDPLTAVHGTGPKLWSMMLAEPLLVGDPGRERWVSTGTAMIAVDTLVHAYLHRTGVLRRLGVEHAYGPCCYGPGGCVDVIEGLARRTDARFINPAFPPTFPRLVQHALWQFCAGWGWNICNGIRVDDWHWRGQHFCPAYERCDRVALKPWCSTAQG